MKHPHSPQWNNPRYAYGFRSVVFGFDFLVMTSWTSSKSFFEMIGSCLPS
ncbi:MAG: hypothetical protein ABSF56_02265 [Minisyncoccia bacterium]